MLDCLSLEGRSASQFPPSHPFIHQHICSILLSATQEILLKNKKIKNSQIDFLFFGGGGLERGRFYMFLRAKVKAEMEILKVTNPITVKENVVAVFKMEKGNKLIAAEESTQ